MAVIGNLFFRSCGTQVTLSLSRTQFNLKLLNFSPADIACLNGLALARHVVLESNTALYATAIYNLLHGWKTFSAVPIG